SGLIDGEAEGRFAGPAVVAEAAGHIERKHDAVAGGNRGHPLSHLLDDSHVLVAERDAGFGVRATFVHVQVRTADRRRGDADDHIRGIDDPRIVDLLDGDFAWPFVDDCLHQEITSTAASATALGSVRTTSTPLFTAALLPARNTGERSDMASLVSVARLPRPDTPLSSQRCPIVERDRPHTHPRPGRRDRRLYTEDTCEPVLGFPASSGRLVSAAGWRSPAHVLR